MESTLSESKKELLGRLLRSGARPVSRKPGIQPRPPGTDAPMSYGQQLVWLHSQFSTDVPLYNEPVTVHRLGPLDRLALEKAFTEIIRRHEAWRTTFGWKGGELVQRVQPAPEHICIPFLDVSTLPADEREAAALKVATEDALAPFDLAVGPMYRPRLIRFSEDEHRLFLGLHHIIFDGVSLYRVFLPELQALYDAFSRGEPSPLEEPSLQFPDYAIWHHKWVEEITPAQLAYWREKLKGVQRRDILRPDHPRTGKESFRGAMETLALDIPTSTALKDLSLRSGVTLFMTLLASFLTLIWAYTREDDLLSGGTSAGRNRTETDNMMGFFLNTVVLRTDMSGDPTFLEVIQRGRDELLNALANDGLPFATVVKELSPQRDGSKNAFFQVSFSFEPSLAPLGPNWKFTQMDIETGAAKFDLHLELDERHDGIIGRFIYNSELFEPHTIQEMLETWQSIVEQVVVDPNRKISELVPPLEQLRRPPGVAINQLAASGSPILSDAERNRVLYEWNDTRAEFPADQCIHEMFEAQAAKSPEATAVVFEGASISYAELDGLANRLAHYLRSLGVKPDARVAICIERSFEMVVALLAVLKAGGAYVPLDPSYPAERLRYMLEDSAPVALLTQTDLAAVFTEQNPDLPVVDLTAKSPYWSNQPSTAPDRSGIGLTSRNLAYVIYTSGSTGKPKGVMVEHRSLVNRLVWMQNAYQLKPSDAVLQKTPFSFDVSVWEFFWPLMVGTRLVMARPEGHKDPAYLVETIVQNKITTLHFVPSMLHVFLDYSGGAECTTLTCVVASGEALPLNVARTFEARLPHAKLHNLYGPTETTVDVTAWTYTPSPTLNKIPIGKPIANTRTYILDENKQPVAVGEAGELYIGGVGVARGYLNRPELTAERFLPDPFAAEPDARMYRSGDLCRWLADGNLEYIGRNDFQVKIRGFRIELGEIESRLRDQAGVRDAVVIASQDITGDKRLVAYVVPAAGADLRDGVLREALMRDLPDYMVPSSYVGIRAMPLSANGKLDRSALPAPTPENLLPPTDNVSHSDTYVPPSDALEAQMIEIWEEILGVSRVGVRDDFFQLGGHSLHAASMVARVGEKLGKRLPLAAMFHAPTIEKLAAVIRDDGWTPHWSVLVPMQEHGNKPPLFLAHGLTGNVLSFYGLRHHIPHDQPVYGIQAHGLSSGRASLLSIPEMAAYYVQEMRAFQPSGPYFLGGFSAGGLLAYEMAQQLTAAGERVAFLALFDSYIEGAGGYWFKSFYSRRALRMSLLAARYSFHDMRKYGLAYMLRRKVRNFQVNLRIMFWLLLGKNSAKATGSSRSLTIPEAFTRAIRVYQPKPYPGPAVLFRTLLPGVTYSDPSAGWRNYVEGPFEIREVEGDHEYIFREPYIGRLAMQLNEALTAAHAEQQISESK
jgi:amino acid adenylation domain-containing protein